MEQMTLKLFRLWQRKNLHGVLRNNIVESISFLDLSPKKAKLKSAFIFFQYIMEVPLLTENSFPTFEDFQHQNGMIYRWASEFLMMLGYMDIKEQKKLIEKTMKALINL
jgi:hypothetical protein